MSFKFVLIAERTSPCDWRHFPLL